ncbi:transcriptional regulator [Sphaerisporangium siamense]|uniref:DNA-binding HxlR family transcriptional regulator n=1 Tax=Sphaerisporangium siamense TaxID=795645 RepID=A0A7W7G943_9ACTN|nr:helix-turn-helix domain-containing protein [Sphaerisporangium siamense]MBB4700195.1 DNA-binding HxlR family transcriptional regulator [Sphaerisporangium siamense]GII84492.1 transcriptional regulator [Sphaerisporangium siamense]
MDTASDQCTTFSVDAYMRDCASRTVLDAIANKWTCLLVDALRAGPVRFGVLRRRLDGITQKSLTQTLRTLERDGMVIRTVYPTIPPRVEYELSELGMSVVSLMKGIKHWAEEHVPEIVAARAAFDRRATEEPVPISTPTPAG